MSDDPGRLVARVWAAAAGTVFLVSLAQFFAVGMYQEFIGSDDIPGWSPAIAAWGVVLFFVLRIEGSLARRHRP